MIQKTALASGLRIITDTMDRVRSASIGVWIRTGSVDEDDKEKGISHFLEHMLFKGTKSRSAKQIAQSIESLGGSLNASTGKELSVYTAHVVDADAPVALEVLADLLQNPRLAAKDIELERNVILTEINHAMEDPEEMALDYLYLQLYPEHPLGHFIYGSVKHVRSFQRKDFLNYLQKHYSASRIVISAAGNVNHRKIVRLVEKHFNTAHPVGDAAPVPPLPEQYTLFHKHSFPTLQQAHIAMGTRVCSYSSEDKYGLLLLDAILGGGMSSRLFQHIRERYGFAYSVYSFIDLLSTTGVFGLYIGCDPGRVRQSLELLQTELTRLYKQGVKQEELEMIKTQTKGGLILGLEGSSARMRRIGENEIYSAAHLTPEQVVKKIEKLQRRDLAELIEKYLDPARFSTVLIAPEKNSKPKR
jgi:predicted Zn-dependent peptidase